MKRLATALMTGVMVGSLSVPAIAQQASDMPGGPGMYGGHKHMNVVLRAYNNQANGNVYTMMGMEMLRSMPNGCYGGFGFYKGINLGAAAGADAAAHGGLLVGKDFGTGPLTVGVGALLGMGYDLVASPTLTFSDFAAYFVGEPRISVGWVMNPHAELSLTAGYLATTNPSQAGGPTLMLTMSMIRMGWGHMRGGGGAWGPHMGPYGPGGGAPGPGMGPGGGGGGAGTATGSCPCPNCPYNRPR